MSSLSPYPYAVSKDLASNNALQSFTHEQMTATANALYNLYCYVDVLKKGVTQQERYDLEQTLIAHCDAHESTIDSVHKALANCCLALEIAHKSREDK